jgi:hypothetical protein
VNHDGSRWTSTAMFLGAGFLIAGDVRHCTWDMIVSRGFANRDDP